MFELCYLFNLYQACGKWLTFDYFAGRSAPRPAARAPARNPPAPGKIRQSLSIFKTSFEGAKLNLSGFRYEGLCSST